MLDRENEAVEARLPFNPIEFDGIKTGVVNLFPDAEELHGVAVAHPVGNQVIRPGGIFGAGDVGQANVVRRVLRDEVHHGSPDFDAGFCGLFHVLSFASEASSFPASGKRSLGLRTRD